MVDDVARRASIALRDVGKRYGDSGREVVALEGVTLEVFPGELVVVLGPSGCGKTTLLNLLGALDTPTSGEIEVAGHSLTGARRRDLARFRRSSVSFVFQSFNLFPGLTALENVRFAADITRRDHAGDVAVRALSDVGLADRMAHFPHQLSGGEQQRVAIARALASGNPVMLCDEPTGELDFETGIQILQLLVDQAARGTTVVVVTHNREIARIADRVISLSGGRVTAAEPPDSRVAVSALRW